MENLIRTEALEYAKRRLDGEIIVVSGKKTTWAFWIIMILGSLALTTVIYLFFKYQLI